MKLVPGRKKRPGTVLQVLYSTRAVERLAQLVQAQTELPQETKSRSRLRPKSLNLAPRYQLTSCYRSIGSNLRPFSAVPALSHQVKRRSHLKLHLQTRNYAGIGLLSHLHYILTLQPAHFPSPSSIRHHGSRLFSCHDDFGFVHVESELQ